MYWYRGEPDRLYRFFFFASRRRHTRLQGDWSSDVCSSDLRGLKADGVGLSQGPFDGRERGVRLPNQPKCSRLLEVRLELFSDTAKPVQSRSRDRKSVV